MKFLKFFSVCCLSVSIFLLVYTFYRSEIFYEGNNREFYKIYYIISFVFLIFSIFIFYLNNVFKTYVVIILSTIVFTFYSFEIFLLVKQNKKLNFTKNENLKTKNFDNRTLHEAYNDLKKDDPNLVVSFMTKTHNFSGENLTSFSGISNSNTLFCNELGYYSTYISDRYGFNNPDNSWDSNSNEYVIIGDSTAQGACVNRPNDIASVLRNITNKNVINLGIRGTGPLTQYAILKEYLTPNTKNILWFFSADNDLDDLVNEINHQALSLYLNDNKYSQNLKLKQNLINNSLKENILYEEKRFTKINSKKYIIFKHLKLFLVRSLFKPDLEIPAEFEKVLKMTSDLAFQNNSNLYFIYIPNLTRYFDIKYINYDLEIKKIVKDLDINYLNLHDEVFSKQKNPKDLFPFNRMGHPNIKGYEIIAKTVNKILSR